MSKIYRVDIIWLKNKYSGEFCDFRDQRESIMKKRVMVAGDSLFICDEIKNMLHDA